MIKLMTYNIMSGKNYQELKAGKSWTDVTLINPSLVSAVIKKHGADIVGLNEVHGEGFVFNNQTEQIAEEAGYSYSYFAPAIMDNESPYGNAVLSKYPIIEAGNVLIPAGSYEEDKRCEGRSIAKTVIDVNGHKVMVLVTHFGLALSEKQKITETVKKIVAESVYPCILMGDLNMKPYEPLIQELRCILKDTAPSDIDEKWYTHSSDKPEMKIDYIFVDKNIKVEKAEALDETPSDHRPYMAKVLLSK
ncbi:MAG: endonuclease/exonuclease/phosphatase family protein [Clostridia bacterium]|nr:endonuclease/exonuclease/phosphatase family protein [Clostridia bacterium]